MSGMPGLSVIDSEIGSVPSPSIRNRGISSSETWKIPRRYVMAIMCNLAFFIRGWIIANISMIFYHFFVFSTAEDDEPLRHMPTIANFTFKDGEDILVTSNSAFIVGQIPAAILIIKFSPYKIMQISMLTSSFLQLITPWTINVSAIIFAINIIIQGLCVCPLECACIGIWREWAPSAEKSSLLMISFSGKFIYAQVAVLICIYLSENVSPVSIHYFAGIAGIIWCILWTCIISDSPANDPLITESELQYLEEKIPLQNKEKIILKTIPLKAILTSYPVLSICLVLISSAFSSRSILDFLLGFQVVHLLVPESATNWMFLFLIINCIVLVPAAGALSDILINRNIVETTNMRKLLCVGALVIHALFLMLLWVPDTMAEIISFTIATIIFPYTFAGILPNVLDISPRYSCIIMALAMTLHSVSSLSYDYLLVYFISDWTNHEWAVAFIPVELIALLAAIIFFLFGSGEEQLWSSSPSSNEGSNQDDTLHYPQTDLEDEMLITSGL